MGFDPRWRGDIPCCKARWGLDRPESPTPSPPPRRLLRISAFLFCDLSGTLRSRDAAHENENVESCSSRCRGPFMDAPSCPMETSPIGLLSWKRAAISMPRSRFGSRCQIARCCCCHKTNRQHSQRLQAAAACGIRATLVQVLLWSGGGRHRVLTTSPSMRYAP